MTLAQKFQQPKKLKLNSSLKRIYGTEFHFYHKMFANHSGHKYSNEFDLQFLIMEREISSLEEKYLHIYDTVLKKFFISAY
jgi:hypothetical protein